jgi:hypothetical protein
MNTGRRKHWRYRSFHPASPAGILKVVLRRTGKIALLTANPKYLAGRYFDLEMAG